MARSEEAQHAYNMRRRVQRCIDKIDWRLALLQGDVDQVEHHHATLVNAAQAGRAATPGTR